MPSRVFHAPFVQPRSKPGREVCNPQAEGGSQLMGVGLYVHNSRIKQAMHSIAFYTRGAQSGRAWLVEAERSDVAEWGAAGL